MPKKKELEEREQRRQALMQGNVPANVRAEIQIHKGQTPTSSAGYTAAYNAAARQEASRNAARQLYEQYQRELTDRMRNGGSMRRGGGEDMYNRWRTETYAKARAGTASAEEVAAIRSVMGRETRDNINFGADLDENRARYYSRFDADEAQKQLDRLMESKRAYEKATRGNDAELRMAQIGQLEGQISQLQREIDNAKTIGAEVRKQERIAERERNKADLSNVDWDNISTADIVKLGIDNADLSTVDAEAVKRRMDREKKENNLKIAGMEELYNQARSYQYDTKGEEALGDLDPQTMKYIETLVNRRGTTPNSDYFNGTLNQGTNSTPFDVDPAQFEESAEVQEARAGLKAAGYTDEEISQLIDYRQRQVNKKNYQQAVKDAQKMAQDSPVGASALSVATNLGSGFGMLDALGQKIRHSDRPLDYYTGNMVPSAYTNAIREQVGSDIAKEHGQLGNFLYQTGMSMADSAVNTALAVTGVPEWFGLSIMGGSAGTKAMQDARDRGVSDTQAMVTGLAAGVAEGLFEKLSLEKVLHTKAIDADKLGGRIMQLLRNLGTQGFTEGSEEFFTTLANTITDKIINGDQSEFDTNVRRYMLEDGLSNQEAKKKATADWVEGLAQDFAGGFLSGGVMGGVGTVRGNAMADYQFGREYKGDRLSDAISETLENAPNNSYAQRAKKQTESGKKVSGHTIRRMMEANENAIHRSDVAKVTDSIEGRLVELGESKEDAKRMAPAIAKQWAAEQVNSRRSRANLPETDRFRLTAEERNALRDSTHTEEILRDLNNTAEEGGPEWVKPIETKAVKTGTQQVREFNQFRENITRAAADQMDENTLTVDDTEELEQQFGKAGAEAFSTMKPANMNSGVYYHAFNTAYLYGSTGATLEQARNAVNGRLENSIVDAAFAAGESQRQFRLDKEAERIRTQITGDRNRAPGTVTMLTDEAGFTDVQRSSVNVIRRLADVSGINFKVFESGTDEKGNFVGKNGEYDPDTNTIMVDINAGRTSITDAWVPVMLKTASHELTHFIQHNNAEGYEQLKTFVSQHLIERGENLEDLAKKKVEIAREGGIELSPDAAMDEVIADACENMLRDTKAIDTLAKENWGLFKWVRNWIRNFHQALKRAFTGEGHRYKEADLMLDKMAELQKIWDDAFVRAVENYQRTMDGRDAADMVSNGQTVGVEDGNGHAQLSLRTYDEGGRAQLKKFLDNQVKNKAITREEANEMMAQMEEIYDICKEFSDEYGLFGQWSNAEVVVDSQTGKPVFSVVKANGEYAMNLDFSLVCKKRRTLDAVFAQMINDGIMEDFDMVESSIAAINDIIRDNGFETACALCFVDAKRYRQGIVADAFVSMYNDLVRSMIKDGQHADAFNFGGNSLIVNDGKGIDTLKNSELDFTRINEVLKSEDSKTVLYKIAKDLKENPADRKLLLRGDFMSAKAFDTIKETNQRIMGLYNAKKGAGGPKASSLDVQYLSEILAPRKFNVSKAYSVGGVRIQSFSDYMPRLVFDYVQMIGDLAAKKLPAHAYTKEALFALQFGLSGIKTNMSLVPEVIEGGVAPGLDADGNYAWRDGQSFGSTVYGGSEAFIRKCYEIIGKKYSGQDRLTAADGFELAKAIQSAAGYGVNCGTIAVGVSDAHIRKMLRDPDIRMVIPYHKSSLNHIVAVMTNIDRYTDYTGVQNTRNGNGTKLEKGQKDFNYNEALQRLGDAKAAADEYLAWCDKRGYIPKFDQFRNEEGYYKLLEDFTTYDMNGEAAPQGGVTLTLPGVDSAFGSMQDLIRMGLEEDALLQGKQDAAVPEIVKQIKNTLPTFEAEQRVQKSERVTTTDDERSALKAAVATVQTLNRKSISQFSSEEIRATEPLANKLWGALGTKSPYFRAWFGDWRVNDNSTHVGIVTVTNSQYKAGKTVNADTNRVISWGSDLKRETTIQQRGGSAAISALGNIEDIVKNAVLLDTHASSTDSKTKMSGTAFMHSFYALVEENGKRSLLKLYVEEALPKNGDLFTRAYELKDIKKVAVPANGVLRNSAGLTDARIATIDTIADLCKVVKMYDPDYKPIAPSKVVNKDGMPKVVYHATDDSFTIFDREQLGKNTDGNATDLGWAATAHVGHWFNTEDLSGKMFMQNSMPVYLRITSPLTVSSVQELADMIVAANEDFSEISKDYEDGDFSTARKAGKRFADWMVEKGYDGIVLDDEEFGGVSYVVLNSNQVKSATGNIGTFDKGNDDIQYSLRSPTDISSRELLANALDSVAQNEAERDILQRYQKRIADLNEIQRKLAEQRRLIHEDISGVHKLTTDERLAARNRAETYARQLERADKALLNLESMGPVKAMLEREHKAFRKAVEAKERSDEALKRYNERMQKRIEAARQSLANYRAKRWDTESRQKLRDKISRSVKSLDTMLRNPTDQKHIPDGLQGAVLDLLQVFTNDTSVFDKNKLARVTAEYQKLQTSDTNLAGQYDEDIPEMLNYLSETIAGRRLSQLSAEELGIVRDIVDHFKFMVKNENAIFVNGRRESLEAAAAGVIEQSQEKGTKQTAAMGQVESLARLLTTGNIKPEYFFRDIGGDLQRLWRDILNGQSRYAFNLQAAKLAKEAIQQETGYGEWWNDKTTYNATTEAGQSITLNLGQALSLLATYQRELAAGNTNHVTMGGFLYAEDVKKRAGIKDLKSGKIPGLEYRSENRDAHPMSQNDMEALTEWLKSVDERTLDYVARMVQYLSEDMSALGNETSMELYGYKKFGEEYYYPIKSAEEFLKQEPGQAGYDNTRWKHKGFTKAVLRGANNPFVLMDFDEVWGQHVSQMCMYNGMAVAQDNIVRLLNYKTPVSEFGPSVSVKSAFKTGYGERAYQYIDTLLSDINGGIMIDPREGAMNSMISLFKKNAVFASLSVAIQQPSSIARAMAVMDPKYLVKTAAQKRNYEELKKYSGVAIIKEIGGFDTNTGRGGAEWLMTGRKSTVKEKYENAATWLPQKMDEITWAHLWNAVKAEITDTTDLKVGSDEYFERCGQRFDEVIELTQVYDSVLTRSENMRSKSGLVKAATAFMAEPTTTLNMMVDALQNAKKNPKQLARTMGAVLASVLLNNFLKAIVTATRDKRKEDADKTWLEKYVKKLVEGIRDDARPGGYIPLVKDIKDIADGYTVEASYASVVSDLVKALQSFREDPTVDSGIDAIAAISGVFGVPTKNLVRDIRGVVNTFVNTQPLDETTKRGLQVAFDEAMGFQTALKDDVASLYKADQKGNAADRKKWLNEISLEYEDKVKHFMNAGYSKDEAAKKARSSVMSTVTTFLKPLYQAAKTTAEKNKIRSLALRIYFGGGQLYGKYDFDKNWG